MAGKVFLQILNMSYTASFVIILVVLIRLFLRKYPKMISYSLWSVVLFRLICPFSYVSRWSLLPTSTISLPINSRYSQTSPFNTGGAITYNTVNTSLPEQLSTVSIDPLQVLLSAGRIIWLIGIVALIMMSIASLLRLRWRLVGSVRLRDNIYLADHITSPFVLGVIHPKIYLPSTLSVAEQGFIIQHEQAHIRRFDHMVRILAFVVVILHWFNPLVWLAYILSGNDMEMSCDESVIKHMDRALRADYSALLLSLTTGRRIITGAPLAFNEGDVKNRIKNIMNYKRPAFWVISVALFAVILLVIGLSGNPRIDQGQQLAKELETDDINEIERTENNPGIQNDKENLSFAALKTIINKKKNLTWDDFAEYNGSAVGSGLYILSYVIDEHYYLLIGGPSPAEEPWYVRLYHSDTNQYIDIEEENIDDFINRSEESNSNIDEDMIIDNIGSVIWYIRSYQGAETKFLNVFDRYEIIREELNPEKASLTVIDDKLWSLWDKWNNILITLDRFIYLAAKDDEDVNIKSPVLVSQARNGGDRKIYEAPYRVINQLTMDDITGKIYFTGWTNDQTFPQPLYETDENLNEIAEILQLNGWLIKVYNGYAYYFTADKNHPGIYRVPVSGTEEPELFDKLGFVAENYTPVIYSEINVDASGKAELHFLLKRREGDVEGRVPISH